MLQVTAASELPQRLLEQFQPLLFIKEVVDAGRGGLARIGCGSQWVDVLGRQHGTGVRSDGGDVIHDARIVVRTELPRPRK